MGLNNGNFRVEILPFLRVRRWNDRLWNVWDGIMKEFCLKDVIECFHSCGQHLWKFFGTKESVCIRKEFNSHRICLEHQHGRRFIVLQHQYGRRDVMWKHPRSICTLLLTRPHDLYWKWAGTYYSEVSRGVLFWILGGGFASRFLKLWPYFTRS